MSNNIPTSIYATRTDSHELNLKRSDKEYIIGLDLGYSSTKCVTENKAFCLPSYAKEIKGDLIGGIEDKHIIYTNEEGRKYGVGERALKDISQGDNVKDTDIYGRNHYLAPEYLIQFRVAMGLALWNKKTIDMRPVFIETGLPPAYLKEDSVYMRKIMEGHHKFTLQKGREVKNFDFVIDSKQIDIIIQPMGTLASIGADETGKNQSNLSKYLKSKILIFDAGFGTLDTFYIRNGEVKVRNTDDNLGMKRVIEETRTSILNELEEKYKIKTSISIPEMQVCLETGVYRYIDKINFKTIEINIAPLFEEANERIKEEAFSSCSDKYGELDYLVITGGTGAAWFNYFKTRLAGLTQLKVIPGNMIANYTEGSKKLAYIYANARGYYMARLANSR